ncbi:MAG: hypothetical protein JKY34_10915 [Kordiimonadaceae bacterium]|nr:hypothetical protein [Kordiimonadaceae bacterium]
MSLKTAYYSVTQREAAKFASEFHHLRLDNSLSEYPLNNLFKKTPDAIQKFFDAFGITASHKPKVLGRDMTENGERTIIQLYPWKPEMREMMLAKYPTIQWLETSAFQKFYKDHCGNSPHSVLLKGPFGHTFLDYNNVGAIGADVNHGTRVNLFVGASDMFNASKSHIGYSANHAITDWVLETEVPFAELATNMNGSMEGANYAIIIDKAKKYLDLISKEGGILENLFVFGGWHNLIYGRNTPKDWTAYADELLALAPRVVFYEIISPILKFSQPTILKYAANGMGKWGDREMNPKNYNELKGQMLAYNEWLKDYCASHENALMIPTQTIIDYEETDLTTLFMDINHFRRNDVVSEKIIGSTGKFLADNAEFFAPQLSNVSEYIYPIF